MNRTLNFYEHKKPGKLITFCGLDGCGKSTMLRKLWSYLDEQGYELTLTKQPTDFVRQSAIFRTYMDSPVHDNYDYRSLSLLAASDRVQHTNRVIIPELEEGKIVLSDRYFYSCLANLRARGYDDDQWIYDVASSIAKPDLAIFLDTSVETAVARVRNRSAEKERYIDMDLQYKLKEQYRIIAEENNCLLVSSELGEDETFTIIKEAVDKLFAKAEDKIPARQMVQDLLCELSGQESVSEEATLLGDLGLDSLDMVTMLVTIEDKLNVELLPEDMNPFDLQTVGDVMLLAEKYEAGDLGE
jgi:dTMP kinase